MATKTPKELAVLFDSDARTVRKFLRSEDVRVGKGHRHAIEAKSVKSMQKRFNAWIEAKRPKDADDATDAIDTTDSIDANDANDAVEEDEVEAPDAG